MRNLANLWKVVEKIEGDTFKLESNWTWKKEKGDIVRPIGYNTPEKGHPDYQKLTEKLKRLLLNKMVELKNCVRIDRGRLVCSVYLDGKDIAIFFPEYQ